MWAAHSESCRLVAHSFVVSPAEARHLAYHLLAGHTSSKVVALAAEPLSVRFQATAQTQVSYSLLNYWLAHSSDSELREPLPRSALYRHTNSSASHTLSEIRLAMDLPLMMYLPLHLPNHRILLPVPSYK